jgi:hypothetical protein
MTDARARPAAALPGAPRAWVVSAAVGGGGVLGVGSGALAQYPDHDAGEIDMVRVRDNV